MDHKGGEEGGGGRGSRGGEERIGEGGREGRGEGERRGEEERRREERDGGENRRGRKKRGKCNLTLFAPHKICHKSRMNGMLVIALPWGKGPSRYRQGEELES